MWTYVQVNYNWISPGRIRIVADQNTQESNGY